MTDDEIRKLIQLLEDSVTRSARCVSALGMESVAQRLERYLPPCPPGKLRVLVEVDIDPEKWAAEYFFGEGVPGEGEVLNDAKEYVPSLIKEGLSRQEEWGVLKVVRTTLV